MAGEFDWRTIFLPEYGSNGPSPASSTPEVNFIRDFLRTCPLGIYILNADTRRFIYANEALESIIQYSAAELKQLAFDTVVAEEDRDRVSDLFRRRRLGDPTLPRSYEMLVQNRYGEKRVVYIHPDLVRIEGALLGAVRDVTGERIMSEPVLFNQRVDSLASLAGGFANEFNNLLGVISGYTQLAMTRLESGGDAFGPLQTITVACQKAAFLVQSILTFARRGSHGLESVDLSNLLHNMANLLRSTCPPSISVDSKDIQAGLRVRGDVTQLEQAILNILANAEEVLEERGGTIRLSTRTEMIGDASTPELAAGAYVTVRIEDSGPGIPIELQSKVMEPFFTTKNSAAHPGLGLSTAFGVARSHGGSLSLESEVGVGTSVTLFLPRDKEPSDLVPALLEKPKPSPRSPLVLVVDDQTLVAELLGEVLLTRGFEVAVETQPRVALQAILNEEISPHLLIVDLMMPELDGRSLILRLRRAGFTRPIVVISGYAMPAQDDEALSGMIQGFVKKPFQNSDLVAVVESALAQAEEKEEVES